MQFRSLLLLGFGVSLAMNVSAFAAPPVPASPAPEASAVVNVATKAEEEALKKKKAAAITKAKSKPATTAKTDKTKQTTTAKADKAKADKEKLAKATAEKDKLLKAKAEKDKQLAKAKAEKDKQLAAAKAEREKKLAAAKAEKEKLAAAAKVERDKKLAAAKVEREKLMAERAKATEERKVKLAQLAEERKLAREQAAEQSRIAREKAAEERRLLAEAKARAKEEQRLARIRAEEERQAQIAAATEAARQAEIAQLVSMEVVQTGNNSELRSERVEQAAPKQTGLFAGLFGGQQIQKQSLLPETRALDAALEQREAKKKFKPKPEFVPQVVEFSGYPTGTIVVDTANYYLYLVESPSRARRYGIAVGKEGLQYKGAVKVGDKQEWPRWIPTKEMIAREPAKYGRYADGMPGGGQNPLGARAIYLYNNGKDTYLRIHGTIAPESIGTRASNGCFRMINDDVMDLYRRVPVGTNVVVL